MFAANHFVAGVKTVCGAVRWTLTPAQGEKVSRGAGREVSGKGSPLGIETDLSEAQEDQAEDGRERVQPGISVELVSGIPELFFQGIRRGVFS